MLADMPASWYADWLAFEELEPIGEKRADIRSAMATAAMLNAQGAKPKARVEQFMPFRDPDPPKTLEQLMQKAAAFLPRDDGNRRGDKHELHGYDATPGEGRASG